MVTREELVLFLRETARAIDIALGATNNPNIELGAMFAVRLRNKLCEAAHELEQLTLEKEGTISLVGDLIEDRKP